VCCIWGWRTHSRNWDKLSLSTVTGCSLCTRCVSCGGSV
jgi:hypothetical protein